MTIFEIAALILAGMTCACVVASVLIIVVEGVIGYVLMWRRRGPVPWHSLEVRKR